jgi:integrase/recombinase XerD
VQFDQYLTLQNLAPTTRGQYDRWVRRYERWAYTNRIVPDSATPLELAAWVETLPETWATRKAAQAALRHYFGWAGRDDRPEQTMRVPRRPRMQPRPLCMDDLHTLRQTAEVHGGRQGLAVLLAMYTGARRAEVAGMPWAAFQSGHVRWVRVKTGDITALPVHPRLAAAVAEYRRDSPGGLYLFPGDRGRPHVSPTTVWEWIRHVGRIADVDLSPHMLRHSFATVALRATKDARAVQEGMGHRSLDMTAGYSQVSEGQLEAVVGSLDF